VPLGVKNNTTFDFTLSQLIFSGEYIVGLQATKVFLQISEKNLVKIQNTTKENVTSTYFLVLVLGESQRVLNESLITLEKTYNEMSKMNQQGFTEDTDVAQISISLSNLKRLISSVESQREVSLKLLKFQLGVDFSQSLVLTDSINGLVNDGNIKYLSDLSYNVKNSVDYQIVDNLEKSTALLLKREQSKYLPTLSAFYRRHEQTNQPSFNFAVKDIVGFAVNVPLFTSGQRNSKISQARFELEKSQLNKANAEQGLIMEFETALSTYQTAFNNFNTSSETINLSKKVYDKAVIKFHEGISSSFELSQIQNQYLNAESGYYASVLTLLSAKAKLDRILSTN
jgi:outer membrane protein TolC